jgi:hypothetical protein
LICGWIKAHADQDRLTLFKHAVSKKMVRLDCCPVWNSTCYCQLRISVKTHVLLTRLSRN